MSTTQPSRTADSIVSVVLLRDDGAALMQLRDKKPGLRHAGMWVMPGGHTDPGETVEAGARRELCEETGYACHTLHWLTAFDDHDEQGRPLYPVTVFWAPYDNAQAVRCLEGQALQFIERRLAGSYPIPDYLIGIWDLALAAQQAAAPSDDGHGASG